MTNQNHDQTAEQLTKAIEAELEFLKITREQLVTAIEYKNITPAERLRNALKRKVDLKSESQTGLESRDGSVTMS